MFIGDPLWVHDLIRAVFLAVADLFEKESDQLKAQETKVRVDDEGLT